MQKQTGRNMKKKTELYNNKVTVDRTESNNNLSKLISYTSEQIVRKTCILDSNNSRIKKLTKPVRAIKKEKKRKHKKAISSRNSEEIRKALYKVDKNNCIQIIHELDAKSAERRLIQISK